MKKKHLLIIFIIVAGIWVLQARGQIFTKVGVSENPPLISTDENGEEVPLLPNWVYEVLGLALVVVVALGVGGIYLRSQVEQKEGRLAEEIAEREWLERLSHKTLEAVDAGAWEWDMETDQSKWSGKNYTLLGLKPGDGDATHEMWLNCLHPSDRDMAVRIVEQAVKEKSGLNFEYRVIWPDGSIHWLNEIGNIVLNDDGVPIKMYGIQIDVSGIKQTENKLLEIEAHQKNLLELAPTGIVSLDENKNIIFFNKVSEQIFGYSVEEIIGEPWNILFSQEVGDHSAFFQNVFKHPNDLEEYEFHHWGVGVRKSGKEFPAEFSISSLDQDGEMVFVLAIHDTSEKEWVVKTLQQQAEDLYALVEASELLQQNLDQEKIFEQVCNLASNQFGLDLAIIGLFQEGLELPGYLVCSGIEDIEISQRIWQESLMEGGMGRKASVELEGIFVDNLGDKNGRHEWRTSQQLGFSSAGVFPLIVEKEIIGLLQLYSREKQYFTIRRMEALQALVNQISIALGNAKLLNSLEYSNLQLEQAYDSTLEGWAKALELRDRATEGHTRRVTEMTVELAQMMGINGTELVNIRRGAILHDIGKIGVPDHILNKKGPLTAEEREIIELHPGFAREFLLPIDFLLPAIDIPYSHHEKWDGSGYPQGLKGDEIQLPARIFAIVDVWDALTSDRPYRLAWTSKKALHFISEQSGEHFDPKIVDLFLKYFSKNQFELPNLMESNLNRTQI